MASSRGNKSQLSEEQKRMMLELMDLLEVEHAKLNNLKDEEFTDAYMSFRKRVEEAIQGFLGVNPNLDFAGACSQKGIFYALYNTSMKGLSCSVQWLVSFFLGEGYNLKRDKDTFTLDPAPFDKMIDVIEQGCKPRHSDKYVYNDKVKSYEKMKQFVQGILLVASSTYGLSKAIVEKEVFGSISKILQSFQAITGTQSVNQTVNRRCVEVSKQGSVTIGSFAFEFDGTISKSCCSDNVDVKITSTTKCWKFSTLKELKVTFMSLQ